MKYSKYIFIALCTLPLSACDCGGEPVVPDAAVDGAEPSDAWADSNIPDSGRDSAVGDATTPDNFVDDAWLPDSNLPDAAATCALLENVPSERLWPVPGELFYMQIGIGGLTTGAGESAVVVGPAGEIVIIDVGNNRHDADIVAVLDALTPAMNTAGFAPRAARSVDAIILTHYHSDHVDGLGPLLADINLVGKVIYRGMYDVRGVTTSTVEALCDIMSANDDKSMPLCTGDSAAPCNSSNWNGIYPSSNCDPSIAASLLQFASGSGITPIGVDGYMDGHSYQAERSLFLDENNGENARSIVAYIHHGPMRLLFAGDLTGGGSDTDPVEPFFAPMIANVSDIDSRGVDVLHVNHHGRNTSSSAAWLNTLLPNDGLARNAVMGISDAHVNSPHQETIDALFNPNRLGEGRGWTTLVPTMGDSHANLIDADGGHIIVRSSAGGEIYDVQAISDTGSVRETRRFASVCGACAQ